MSSVLAFTVKPESKFYADYFAVKKEQKRFHDIAVPFLKERGVEGQFYQTPFLAIAPDEDTLQKYRAQLRKNPDSHGFYHFLKKSDLEKAWESEVSAKIDFTVLRALDFGILTLSHPEDTQSGVGTEPSTVIWKTSTPAISSRMKVGCSQSR